MADKAAFSLRERNPDVLTSIANLSNDEVFTPPSFANQMLDTVAAAWAESNNGTDIWADKTVTFLDPFTKSGVFLREIVRRLTDGLEKEIPDAQERVNHILTKQVFGVAITQLTASLARRSVYCSKKANGKHSIATSFTTPEGNIWFERTEHTWVGGKDRVITVNEQGDEVEVAKNGRCRFCGAPQSGFDREESLETHAYAFIHTENVKSTLAQLFGGDMQFDVVVGNPPYQMTDAAGGGVDSSIYHLFVDIAKQLEPSYLTMVIPSRWMGGATRGVGDFTGFRERMLNDGRIRKLVDFANSKEVFPGVDVKGGVCYFVWDLKYEGDATVVAVRDGVESTSQRKLNEYDVFVRDHVGIKILRKVRKLAEPSITEILTADTPFGIASNYDSSMESAGEGSIPLYLSRNGKRDLGYVARSAISKNVNLIDHWKILVPSAGSDGGQKVPDMVLGKPWFCPPPAVCTQTFLAFFLNSEGQARNLETYYRTKFFRYLVSLRKITQNGFRSTYEFVPQQDFSKPWTDEELYAKYKLTQEEIDFIESMIRPMELTSE